MRSVNDLGRRPRRAGAHLLSLFVTPLNSLILRALADGPLPLSALREVVGWPAPSTLRGNLESLVEFGALAERRGEGKSRLSDNSLTQLGEELLDVAVALEAWLADAPTEPIELGSGASSAAIKALVDSWDAMIVRALAPRPLSLVELDGQISDFSYPTLSRRLAAMHLVGLIEREKLEERRRVYRVTDWLRRAVTPLGMAAWCELRHLGEVAAAITWVEVESAFLLTLPLVILPEEISGEFTLAIDTGASQGRPRLSGVRVEVLNGQVVSCSTRLVENPGTWALGTVGNWLDAVFGDGTGLHIGGEMPMLVERVVAAIHGTLTGSVSSLPHWAGSAGSSSTPGSASAISSSLP